MNEKQISLPRAESPESVGVNSRELQAFIDDCEKEGIDLHSFMVIRHGKVAAEAYKPPFSAKYSHMMYSVSKSFTSTAIGFAIEEGYLTLETKFLDVFPELRPAKYDAWLEKLNVFHLLTMGAGKNVSIMSDKGKDNWLENFASCDWAFEPGTSFIYMNENMYVLCAMIHKLVGQSVTEYLTPRLYEPLGIEVPYWERDPRGIETGGWGMFLKLEDLAKFTYCYQQMGKFNGKQIIPENWVIESTKYQNDNSVTKTTLDSSVGYGYCFWRNGGYKNSYRADGMFSQFGIVFEDLDAVLVLNGGNIDEQQTRDAIWRHFPACFIDDDPDAVGVDVKFEPYETLPPTKVNPFECQLEGKTIKFSGSHILNFIGFPLGVLPVAAVFMEKDKAGKIDNIRFKFLDAELMMTWDEGNETNTILAGLDGKYRESKIVLGKVAYTALSMASWKNDNELEVRIRPIETVAERRLVFMFDGKGNVMMKPSTYPPTSDMIDNVKSSVREIVPSEFIGNLAEKVLPLANSFVDPKHYGTII